MDATVVDARIGSYKAVVDRLLAQIASPYASIKRSALPTCAGIYVIDQLDGNALRAGKTGNLQNRLYHDHLMSSTAGNLPKQIVEGGICLDLAAAKSWIYKNCRSRWLELSNERERGFIEHFMLAVVQPKFCDKNKRD